MPEDYNLSPIIVWDFDGVLFETKRFFRDFKAILKRYGIDNKVADNLARGLKSAPKPFSLKNFLKLANISGLKKKQIRGDTRKLFEGGYYLSPWVTKKLADFQELGFRHHLLTFGSPEFQKQKIDCCGTKFKKFFDKITITRGEKSEYLKSISAKNSGRRVFFVDDYLANIDNVSRTMPQIYSIHYTGLNSLKKIQPSETRAIILLAGENSRFWPLGQKRHKALYEVGEGKTVLRYLLEECAKAYIREIVIVRRPEDKSLDEFLKKYDLPWPRVKTVVQSKADGMADAVLRAARFIKKDFFVLDGNQIFFSLAANKIFPLTKEFDGIITARTTDNPSLFGIVTIDSRGIVRNIMEKPQHLKPPQLRIAATYYFKKGFLRYLRKRKSDRNSGFEKAVVDYAKNHIILALPIDELAKEVTLKYPWNLFDIHKIIVNKTKSVHWPKIDKTAKVHATAEITGKSVVSKYVKIGARSTIKNSFIDSCVTINNDCRVVNSIVYQNSRLGKKSSVFDSIIDRNSAIMPGVKFKNRSQKNGTIRTLIKGQLTNTGKTRFGAVIGESVKIPRDAILKAGDMAG